MIHLYKIKEYIPIICVLLLIPVLLRCFRYTVGSGIRDSPPRISVLISAYNDERYVLQCLSSIANQSFQDYEVIIVDDCSEDSTPTIITHFIESDSRFKMLRHSKNRGSLQAKKTAVRAASGRYCTFVDSDDYLADMTSLGRMVHYMEKENPDILAIKYGTESQWNSSSSLSQSDKVSALEGNEAIIRSCFIKGYHTWHLCTKVFQTVICKQAFSMLANTHLIMAEDAYAYFIIAYLATSFKAVQTAPTYIYRKGSGISTTKIKSIESFRKIVSDEYTVVHLIAGFLRAQSASQEFFVILDYFRSRLLSYDLNRFVQLDWALCPTAFDILAETYSLSDVLQQLTNNTQALERVNKLWRLIHSLNIEKKTVIQKMGIYVNDWSSTTISFLAETETVMLQWGISLTVVTEQSDVQLPFRGYLALPSEPHLRLQSITNMFSARTVECILFYHHPTDLQMIALLCQGFQIAALLHIQANRTETDSVDLRLANYLIISGNSDDLTPFLIPATNMNGKIIIYLTDKGRTKQQSFRIGESKWNVCDSIEELWKQLIVHLERTRNNSGNGG